jgi:hypothetical protein
MWTRKFFYQDEEGGDGGNGDGGNIDPPAGDPPADPAGDPPSDPPAGDPPSDPPAAGGPPQDWPDDWRTKLSPDGKHAKTLDRFASPNALLDSYLALRGKVDSGELKAVKAYPDKGKPEEQAAWRKEHGIPDNPEGYSLKFPDGLVVGDDDKPFVEDFLKTAHGVNATPEQVNNLLHWYYGNQEKAVQQLEEKDVAYLKDTEDTLRAEWGGEYRTNVNAIKGLIDTMPQDIQDAFANARLGDGTALMSNPHMARWLVHTARTINPMATVVPGAGANAASQIDDEIGQIETLMRTDRKAYNANEKMQERYRILLGAREKAKQS